MRRILSNVAGDAPRIRELERQRKYEDGIRKDHVALVEAIAFVRYFETERRTKLIPYHHVNRRVEGILKDSGFEVKRIGDDDDYYTTVSVPFGGDE